MALFKRTPRNRQKQKPLTIEVPDGFTLPPKTQWGFCPNFWNNPQDNEISGRILTGSELGPNVSLHHDGDGAEMMIRRPDNKSTSIELAFGDFPGSFISLAFALPEEGVKSLGRQDLLRISMRSSANESFKAYARLNLRHGPNIEQVIRMFEIGDGESFAEFDIFYSEFESNRATGVWIDLIINDPGHKSIVLSDPVILRRVRASL